MNGNTALDLIMSRLVRSDSSQRAAFLSEMNLIISTKLEQGSLIPWFLLQEHTTSFATTVDQEYVMLPTGFLRFDDEMEVGGLWYEDTSATTPDKWRRLTRVGFGKLQYYTSTEETGVPQYFDVLNGRIYLRPVPDAVYNLRLIAYMADDAVTDAATTTRWLTNAADVVLAEVCQYAAKIYLRNVELAASFETERQQAHDRLLRAHTAFIENLKSREMGDA